jgi:flavin reductase (DIM6/NTAB) family NADH-FMN oxidoreductase RutF
MKDLPLSKVYQLLEPGPVVLLTTAYKGRANVMTMSWHMMVEFEPPLVACVVSNADFSFAALRATKECVIAVPALKLAPKVVEVGNCSGRNVEKFEAFGLTRVPIWQVRCGWRNDQAEVEDALMAAARCSRPEASSARPVWR